MKKIILIISILTFALSVNAKKIHTIIYQNNLVALQKYIDKKETLDEPIIMETGDKLHIMEYAAYFNRLSCLKLIVNAKSKINNFKQILSRSFVYALTDRHNDKMINYLYGFNPDLKVTVKELDNTNAIMWAVSNYSSDLYFKLKNKSDLTHIDAYGNNLYHKLANSFESEIFKDLLTHKELDVNLVNSFKETPMNLIFKESNIILIEEFINQKAKFYDHKSAYRDAIISGDDYFYDYVVKKIDTNFNWTLIPSYFVDGQEKNYPLETAIFYDCVYLAKIIIEQMITDIENTNTKEGKTKKFNVLYSILKGRNFENGNQFQTVYVALWTEDKKMFEFVLETMNQINVLRSKSVLNQSGHKKLSYSKSDYKIAIQFYGKPYVDSLNIANKIYL